jgi:hypothetical protein
MHKNNEAASILIELVNEAITVANRAINLYPQPNYVITKWAEETGEATKAFVHLAENRETWSNTKAEIVQSLAMLYRLIEEGDQVHNLKPLKNYRNSND